MKPNFLRFSILLFLLISSIGKAQIFDDFSDGNFTSNPAWIGVTDSFTVSSGQLRTTPGNSSSEILYLATASNNNFTNWEFTFRLNFNPSSQNYAEFWLVTDNLNLKEAQNGYFVRIGGNTSDGVGLFKKLAGTVTEIVPQTNTLANNTSNNTGSLRITRNGGNWELFEKITTSNFVSFGTGNDNSILTSAGVGILIKSTKTNRSIHYFDDIRAEDNSGPDLTAPNLLSAAIFGSALVDLQFSEAVDPAFCNNPALYSLTPNVSVVSANRLSNNATKVRLQLGGPLSVGTNTIIVSQSKDEAGNVQTNPQQASVFYDPVPTYAPRDVVINEIFADESPSSGLPSGEFVELLNTTNGIINLRDFTFSDATTSVSLPRYFLPPGGYLILCKTADTTAYKAFGNTLGISLPSLNNSGDLLTLKDATGNTLDVVNYALSWYKDAIKDDGGFTLEQINPSLKCSGIQNWQASNSLIGGTPGTQNSAFSNVPDTSSPFLDSLKVSDLTTLRLVFNESLSADPVLASQFSIPGLTIEDVDVTGDKSLNLILSTAIELGQNYTLTYTGVKDCEGNAAAQPQLFPFIYLPPAPIPERALVINEIYADETPSLGLPKTEYIEILNTTNKPIQLEGVALFVGSTRVALPAYVLPANGYLTLCKKDSVPSFQGLGPALGISLPLLTNSGTEIRLEDIGNSVIDKVNYLISWYKSTSKQNGGYSLEQINPYLFCSSQDNWIASSSDIGGTPGLQNSSFSNAPDVAPPRLVSFEILDSNTVQLVFSEPMNALPQDSSSFLIPGLRLLSVQNRFPNVESITLNFASRLVVGTKYILTLKKLTDCELNVMPDFALTLGIGKKPERFDLLITEVQADDTPENDLPAAEYIELFNNSNQLLDLEGVQITDGGTPAAIPAKILGAGEYLVLTGTNDAVRFAPIPDIQVMGIPSLPTLNSEGDRLTLLNADGAWIHRFFFEADQYSPYSLWTSGWSLEMMDVKNPCDELNNWAISTAARGGTPGKENSVRTSKPDATAPRLVRLSVPDSVTFRLQWDELVDSVVLSEAEVTVSGGYQIAQRIQSNTDLSSLFLKMNKEIVRNELVTITVGLVKDCAGNATQVESLTTARPSLADSSSWILNEILFDPKTGGSDYVEIKNVSPFYLDLKEIQIGNAKDRLPVSLESLPVPPGGIVLLTESKALTLRDYPKGKGENFLEIPLPSFNSDSGTVRLFGPKNKEWQTFFFSDKLHARILDVTKGVSLEKITPGLPVNNTSSWQSASSDVGFGTPGYENSQSRDFDPEEVFAADPKVFSPNGDGNKDFTLFSFESKKSGLIGNLRIYSADGFLVKTVAESANLGAQGFWKWDGITEDGRQARVGLYMAVLEMIELGGDTKYAKIPVAIAADR